MNTREITKNWSTRTSSLTHKFFMVVLMLSAFGFKSATAQVPLTQLRSIDCGKINLSPAAQIVCLPVANANQYQWEFRDINTNAVVGTKNTSGIVFSSSMVNFLQWNTQYNCAIRARVGFTFGNFGPSCVIGLMENPAVAGVPPTSLKPEFCNASSLLLASTVSCTPVPMGTMYEFEFTNTVTQQVTSVTQSTTYLTLNHPALGLQIGQTYEVRTRGFVFNTWSNVTTVCIVSIELPLTNVVAGFIAPACMASSLSLTTSFQGGVGPLTFAWTGPNGYHSALQNPVVPNPVNGTYSVTVTGSFGSGSGSSSTTVMLNPSPMAPIITGDFNFCPDNIATITANTGYESYMWSNGMQTQSTIILMAGTYTVVVANSFGCTASASVEIAPCASNVASTQVREEDCGGIIFTPDAEFAADEVANATNYEWEFRNPGTLALYASYISTANSVYGDLVTPTLQFNTQYITRVRAEVAGEWGNYGALCTIGIAQDPAITGVPPTQLTAVYCNDTVMSLDSTIACDPVTMGSMYEFEFTDLTNQQVIVASSNIVYLTLSSVTPTLQAGRTYSVRVKGFVYNTWSNYGTACTLYIDGMAVDANARTSATTTVDVNEEINSLQIVENNNDELLAYPNPFENQSGFVIKSNENKNVEVYMFDAVGQLVWSKQVLTNQYEQFNTQDLAPGLYFMSTSNNNKNAVRIIKTK